MPPSPRPLPTLPPELWILILEFSTYPSSHLSHETKLPTSFLSPALTPATFGPRLAHYRATMAHKRNLALVSREWNAYAQPVLYEFVWLARSKQAQAFALTLLCGACCLPAGSSVAALTDPAPSPPAHVSAGVGRFIKRLHVETPPLDRANPADLRLIVDYSPALEVYSDVRSVRRRPAAQQNALFAALAAGGGLRRLSWTSYDDPALVGLGVGLGRAPGRAGAMGARLEYLELSLVSSAVSPRAASCPPSATPGLALPTLRTLKVTLDNAAFAALSTWALPALRHLSVLSADFSYAGEGFARFFAVHGARLRQLELGHSSAHIEEHYVTGGPTHGGAGGGAHGLSLAEWCPALEEFVCSADAAWNWQHPDWIAPHTLLPAHPRVSLIGIRGIDARLCEDFAAGNAAGEAFFFRLREQMESLLRREAFPSLRYVRDMSAGSDALRRGEVGLEGEAMGDARVVRFWEGVLGRCKAEGVWLEDWCGVNVTGGSLRRARAGCA